MENMAKQTQTTYDNTSMSDNEVHVDVENMVKPYTIDDRVDVTRFAIDQNVKMYYTNDKRLSGHIRYDKDSNIFSIALNEKEPSNRQRFTIAHELSHLFLHKPEIMRLGAMSRAAQTEYTPEERAADKLASKILMPRKATNEYLERNKLADKLYMPSTIESLAERFNVSRTMAVQRLRELDYNVPYVSFA